MTTESLTQTRLKELLRYDPDTGFFTWLVSRGGAKAGDTIRFVGNSGYLRTMIDGSNYLVHRLVFLYTTGMFPSMEIDHIDGDKTNNKWENLRHVNRVENTRNKRLSDRSLSGVHGVLWRADQQAWRVTITIYYKDIPLGHYKNIFDAAAARKSAELKYGYHANHGRSK